MASCAHESANDHRFYVYCLFRPDGSPFYIGKGNGNRWRDHEKPSRSDGTYKANVIQQAKLAGLEIPKVIIRSGLTEDEAFDTEIALIKAIGRHPDGPLTNATNGGEGVCGHRHSPETRIKMALAKRGQTSPRKGSVMSEDARQKISLAKRGKPSPNKGKLMSEEQKAKLRAAHAGKTLSEEHRKNISRSLLRNPPNKGKTFSAEYRAKLSQAQLNRCHKGDNDGIRT